MLLGTVIRKGAMVSKATQSITCSAYLVLVKLQCICALDLQHNNRSGVHATFTEPGLFGLENTSREALSYAIKQMDGPAVVEQSTRTCIHSPANYRCDSVQERAIDASHQTGSHAARIQTARKSPRLQRTTIFCMERCMSFDWWPQQTKPPVRSAT